MESLAACGTMVDLLMAIFGFEVTQQSIPLRDGCLHQSTLKWTHVVAEYSTCWTAGLTMS